MPHSLFAPVSAPMPTMTSSATIMPMTQPRTVLNLVHSARSSWAKPSRPVCSSDRYGVRVAHDVASARNSTASLVSSM